MVIGRRVASLKLREIVILCGVFLKHPLYLLPTYRATIKTVKISNRLFGDLHHKDNRTNAFRHALWNYLICKNCLDASGSTQKAVNWSKKITDIHERLSPNKELARAMDLHNNKIGREIFLHSFDREETVIDLLQKKTREAVKVKSLTEIEEEKRDLVFIEEVKIY